MKILSKTQLKKYISIQYFLILFLSKYRLVSLNFNVTKGKKEKLELIVERTRKGGGEIGKLLQTASAFYAPAASAIEMAESYLKDLKKILPCAAYLNGEYGVKDLYAGVPVTIGKKGVEKIIELDLSNEEKKQFASSIQAVKKLLDAAEKIDPTLKK